MPLQVEWKPATRCRPRALAWGVLGFTLFAGFLAGSALTGAETTLYTTGALGVMAVLLTIGSLAATTQVRDRYGCSWLVPAAQWLCAWVGGLLIGVGGRAGEDLRGAEQLRAWFGTGEARAGAGLVGVSVALTLTLTLWSRSRPPNDRRGSDRP